MRGNINFYLSSLESGILLRNVLNFGCSFWNVRQFVAGVGAVLHESARDYR